MVTGTCGGKSQTAESDELRVGSEKGGSTGLARHIIPRQGVVVWKDHSLSLKLRSREERAWRCDTSKLNDMIWPLHRSHIYIIGSERTKALARTRNGAFTACGQSECLSSGTRFFHNRNKDNNGSGISWGRHR